jgi:hypothetical protein
MGFRADDAVVATHELLNSVTGNSVESGGRGVIVKQIGARPATYRVRFDGPEGAHPPLILDDVTDHDIAPAPAPSAGVPSRTRRDVNRRADFLQEGQR